MALNKAILIGNVGKDPEVRYLDNGTAVAQFTLATSESYKTKSGEKVEQTEWHNIVVWRGLAEVVEKYVTKGKQLYIEGRIKTRSWEAKDGQKRYITEVVADNLQMLGSKGDSNRRPIPPAPESSENISSKPVDIAEGDDDLPF